MIREDDGGGSLIEGEVAVEKGIKMPGNKAPVAFLWYVIPTLSNGRQIAHPLQLIPRAYSPEVMTLFMIRALHLEPLVSRDLC